MAVERVGPMTDALAAQILAAHTAGEHPEPGLTDDYCPAPRCDEAWWHDQVRQGNQ